MTHESRSRTVHSSDITIDVCAVKKVLRSNEHHLFGLFNIILS